MKMRIYLILTLVLLMPAFLIVRADDGRAIESLSDSNSKDETRRWEVTGPFGGDVRTMVAAPDNPNLLILGTSDGQLFRSTDGAATWRRIKPGIGKRGLSIDNLVIDPHNSQILYAGAWAVADGMNNEMGVFKSEDGGDTWKLLPDTKGLYILSLDIAPADSNILFAGAKTGLFRSANAGQTWEKIDTSAYPEIHNINSVACDPTNPQIIYAGTHHLAWKTLDDGKTWKLVQKGVVDDSDIMGITVDDHNAKLVYINACSGIYRSDSAGEKFIKVPGIPFSARRTYALLPHPTDPKIVFAGTSEGLWRTKDGGKRWMLLTPKTTVIRAIVIHPDKPKRLYIASDDSGVQVSDNLGDDFTDANNGFIHRHILAFLTDASERGRVLASVYHDGSLGSIFASNDGGETWEASSKGLATRDVFSLHQSIENPAVIYAGTNAGVYRSNDKGATWAYVGKETIKPPTKKPTRTRRGRHAELLVPANNDSATVASSTSIGRYQTVAVQKSSTRKNTKAAKPEAKPKADATQKSKRPVKKPVEEPLEPAGLSLFDLNKQVDGIGEIIDAEGQRVLFAAASDGLYRTIDEKQGWEKVSISGYEGRVFVIATHKGTPGRIYIGTQQGIFVSKDFGFTWENLRLEKNGNDPAVKAIAQATNDPDNMLIGTNQFVYRSTNGGRSWVKKGGGLPAGDFTSVAINPNNPDEMIVCEYSKGGVYRSTNKGTQWARIDAELPTNRVWALMFDPFNQDRIYAGSFSSGVYILTIQKGVTATGQ